MRQLLFVTAAALLISPVASAPAFSQSTTPSAPQAKASDPNEVVCEKQEETGSRLVSKRVCMTRAQWAEQRRLNRQDIEKMQTQRPCTDRC
jgi:invasion protein IalB